MAFTLCCGIYVTKGLDIPLNETVAIWISYWLFSNKKAYKIIYWRRETGGRACEFYHFVRQIAQAGTSLVYILRLYFFINHNYNKMLESDWFSSS